MWEFTGEIGFICESCGDRGVVPIEDFSIECIGGSERGMGAESIYELIYEFECDNCEHDISLSFQVSEYPVEVFNFAIDNSSGATTEGEPEFEYVREIYSAYDLIAFYESTPELISALKYSPELMREITPREFEEVVTEIFRSKGFEVDLTKRTSDGGKDIIAIHTDGLGIKNKYFIECKRYAKDNKVGVALVRVLQGVRNTKDGPNKTILVTTSSFTSGAKDFVENEASSKWDMSLADYNDLVGWVNDYKES
ncbi:MAG: restriction endonuclease [Candidatus Sedimenticola sp. (ex Thyasira tokunagai)]